MDVQRGEKYTWQMAPIDTAATIAIATQFSLSIPVAQVLYSRGFRDSASIEEYLFGMYTEEAFSPRLLKDAERATARIKRAIEQGQKILVVGDYDVDGITSSALMMTCLLPLGAGVNFFLPHRAKDGYGLSVPIVERAAANGYQVLITVDNGISAFAAAARAAELGLDLIITDHHRPHAELPRAQAIVNPNQSDCGYPFKHLAGVGVSFKLMSLLYQEYGRELPTKAYELLLLGTIADVVPLVGENRHWVRYCLQRANASDSFPLEVLKQNSYFKKSSLSATDIAFLLTPQINALGRLQDARDGVQFLIGSDKKKVASVGALLAELNGARKEIERSIFTSIQQQITTGIIDLKSDYIIVAASDQWPVGVIGLVASRLVATYGRPALLLHLTREGKAKGSGRSIAAFNLFSAFERCSDLLIQFGGHAAAAGLSLPVDNINALKERLNNMLKTELDPAEFEQRLRVDAEISLPDLCPKIVSDLRHLEPFGHGNEAPVFCARGVSLVRPPELLKELHVKCHIAAGGALRSVVFFNRPELYERLRAQAERPFCIAGQVSENHWNGRIAVELIGSDIVF